MERQVPDAFFGGEKWLRDYDFIAVWTSMAYCSQAYRDSVSAGAMGLQGERRKDDLHATNVGMVGVAFVSLVVETLE